MFKVNGDNNKMQSIIEKKKKIDAKKKTEKTVIVEERLDGKEEK